MDFRGFGVNWTDWMVVKDLGIDGRGGIVICIADSLQKHKDEL